MRTLHKTKLTWALEALSSKDQLVVGANESQEPYESEKSGERRLEVLMVAVAVAI